MAERTHKHHVVPKSRGGLDEDWNFIELDPYTHAYEHAVDFVLFEHSSQFDFRHEAWPLLPDDLKEAVLNEHKVRFKLYVNNGGPSPIKGLKRAYSPETGEDGFFETVPDGFIVGVPPKKRRPKGLQPAVTRTDISRHKQAIIDAYVLGDSTVVLGERYNTSARTINNYLTKWEVPKRSCSRIGSPDRKPRKKDGYFRK